MTIQQDAARANLLVFLGDKPTIWERLSSSSKSGMSHKNCPLLCSSRPN